MQSTSAETSPSYVEAAPTPVSGAYDVPHSHWSAFLRRFVERHGGAPVSVRMVDAGSHQLLEQRRALPFHGARHAVRTDGSEEILITIGEPPYMLEPYFLVDPTGVRVEQPQDGKLLIRIESRAGRVLTLCFSRRVGRSTGPLTLLA